MWHRQRRALGVVLSAILVCSAGCGGTRRSNFYLLQATAEAADDRRADGPAVTIGDIEFPKYLDRPQIVIREARAHRVQLAEFERWAEPLERNFKRVLAENLAARLGTTRVTTRAWSPRDTSAQRLLLDVLRFDGVPGGEVRLEARWALQSADGGVGPTRHSRIVTPVRAGGYDGFVAAMSAAVSELCGEIAAAL